jgi:aspartate aminotransferase-like enzyme
MSDRSAFGTFFLPGPTEVTGDVLDAMTRPMMGHRGAEFESLYARVQEGLRLVFRTKRNVYVGTSSATGMMETAVRCVTPGPVLALVNGAFSARFAGIARACGRDVTVLEVPLGAVHDHAVVEAALAARAFAAVMAVHSETSTGALTDIESLAKVAHRHGAMILVDSVSGMAGARVETDAWELDFVLTGSQKALALPPGLSFAAAGENYLRHAKSAAARGIYFDVIEMEEFAQKNQTPSTPAISLLYAAEVQLERIRAEGMDARWARHAAMREQVAPWTDSLRGAGTDVGVLAAEGSRAPTVSAITVPKNVKGGALVAKIAERGFVVGTGYGSLKDSTFRIGHMGEHRPAGLARCLDACAEALAEF